MHPDTKVGYGLRTSSSIDYFWSITHSYFILAYIAILDHLELFPLVLIQQVAELDINPTIVTHFAIQGYGHLNFFQFPSDFFRSAGLIMMFMSGNID